MQFDIRLLQMKHGDFLYDSNMIYYKSMTDIPLFDTLYYETIYSNSFLKFYKWFINKREPIIYCLNYNNKQIQTYPSLNMVWILNKKDNIPQIGNLDTDIVANIIYSYQDTRLLSFGYDGDIDYLFIADKSELPIKI